MLRRNVERLNLDSLGVARGLDDYTTCDCRDDLLDRAESYSRDAQALRAEGMADAALIYETVRDELRKVAAEMEDPK